MRPWLPALLALTVVSPVAAPGAEEDGKSKKKLPASQLLPDGSQLHGVVIPRHNKQRKLVNSLMADVVTLVNDEIMAGERVTIDFFDNRGERDVRIKLQQATFNQSIGMLHASEKVTMDADGYQAKGTGLHYAMRQGRGLLTGPATTTIINPPQTAMNSKTPSLIGAAGIALVANTTPVAAQAPANEPAPVRVNTVAEGPISKSRSESEKALKSSVKDSATTDAEVKEFVEKIPLDYEKLTGSKPTPPPSKPLDFKPTPEHTVINCEGGMYFDSDKGLLVYLKNVKVTDPQYILTGADVLQVYMSKKPEEPKKSGKPEKPNADPKKKDGDKDKPQDKKAEEDKGPVPAIGGNFDQVEKIVAKGAVRILQKAVVKGKQPVEASGALFIFHPETGDILLSGGYPWVKQGDFFARAKEPNLTLRMKKNGDFVTEGAWEMGGRLNQNKPKPAPKPDPKPNN